LKSIGSNVRVRKAIWWQKLKLSVVEHGGSLAVVHQTRMLSVIRFLSAEGAKPVEIYTRMLAKYGASCLSKMQVFKWV
jgi:hypothetical protein